MSRKILMSNLKCRFKTTLRNAQIVPKPPSPSLPEMDTTERLKILASNLAAIGTLFWLASVYPERLRQKREDEAIKNGELVLVYLQAKYHECLKIE